VPIGNRRWDLRFLLRGWHSDPLGRDLERFHDGEFWTVHLRDPAAWRQVVLVRQGEAQAGVHSEARKVELAVYTARQPLRGSWLRAASNVCPSHSTPRRYLPNLRE
jgi:hypothetical protein